MGKFNSSKETLMRKSPALVAILYHDTKINLDSILNILQKKKYKILIVLDGIKKIKVKNKNNIKIISLKKSGISICRNFCINYGIKKKFKYLIFFDSDCIPHDKTVETHIKKHDMYKEYQLIGGAVRPSFLKKKTTSLITKVDGIMSWFGAVEQKIDNEVKFPYHIPTLNMSIKLEFLKKSKIKFLSHLKTGEDFKFCKDVKEKGGKILSITGAVVDHEDRKSFSDVINHQSKWGKHQFYTLYNYKFKNSLLFNILFIFFYLPLIPVLSIFISFISMFPWMGKNIKYSKYFLFVFLICNIKCFHSYIECFNDLKKKLT
jgi:cellulose synthase/poly-beta-1,6-N-acetylglucosamine synthase-like glycosyltransferase